MPGYNDYFGALNGRLRDAGRGVPELVVDLDRVDRNIARTLKLHPPDKLRIVAKSLPCPKLLEHIFRKTGRQRLMVFHLPFLLRLVDHFPESDILMGKPLPVAAMRRFYRERTDNRFDDSRQLQWLIDTGARLRQLATLAGDLGRRVSVSVELDIGMHRGGAASDQALAAVLDAARECRDEIRITGFMGYDAHVPKAPFSRSVASAARRAQQRYRDLLELARQRYADLEEEEWCINGAGSPTVALHGASSPLNDVSIGSALVKPAAFDLPTLDTFEAAAWIAAPVLKRLQGVNIPFVEKLPSRNRCTLFIYGGKWMAEPESPDGLRENPSYGRSSNQQMLTIPSTCGIDVDDYVFLRPTQSEAVLLQFGDLCIVRDGHIADRWAVL